jgi:hypothetical protein
MSPLLSYLIFIVNKKQRSKHLEGEIEGNVVIFVSVQYIVRRR